MYRIRRIEERIAERYHENEMKTPIHLVIGQEATCVGACAALRKEDQIYGSHRTHGIYLAKGGSLKAMLAELYCKVDGCTGSRGGSMHLMDHSVGVRLTSAICAGSIPIAVGAALASKIDKKEIVHCVFFGEGASEEGVLWESINFAVVRQLPVIFFCENNGYSVQTSLWPRQPEGSQLFKKAEAFGAKASHVDGMKVLAVKEEMEKAVKWAKQGSPVFIEAKTYRFRAHGGALDDTDSGYRSQEEYERWKLFDPLRYVPISPQMKSEVEREIDEAFSFALSSAVPDRGTLYDYVYQ